VNSNVNYTEPLSKKSFLQIQYGLNYQKSESDKRTYNYVPLTNDYTSLDTLLSNKFTTDYITNKGGLSYRYNDTNFNFNIGVDFQNANLNNERVLPLTNTLTRSFNNILPSARFQYNFDKKKTLRLFYRTSTNAPSVDQLQDVVNNTNPVTRTWYSLTRITWRSATMLLILMLTVLSLHYYQVRLHRIILVTILPLLLPI
jgi:hypothetical protein